MSLLAYCKHLIPWLPAYFLALLKSIVPKVNRLFMKTNQIVPLACSKRSVASTEIKIKLKPCYLVCRTHKAMPLVYSFNFLS